MLEPQMCSQKNMMGQPLYILTCFVYCSDGAEDCLLASSQSHELLKDFLNAHAAHNCHLKNLEELEVHEENTVGAYRKYFEGDAGLYVSYAIYSIRY